jgi:hypothetical protein
MNTSTTTRRGIDRRRRGLVAGNEFVIGGDQLVMTRR